MTLLLNNCDNNVTKPERYVYPCYIFDPLLIFFQEYEWYTKIDGDRYQNVFRYCQEAMSCPWLLFLKNLFSANPGKTDKASTE